MLIEEKLNLFIGQIVDMNLLELDIVRIQLFNNFKACQSRNSQIHNIENQLKLDTLIAIRDYKIKYENIFNKENK